MKTTSCRLFIGLLFYGYWCLGGDYNLTVAGFRSTPAICKERRTTSGASPGGFLRFKEAERFGLNVTTNLNEMTSIHWHGISAVYQESAGISFRVSSGGNLHL